MITSEFLHTANFEGLIGVSSLDISPPVGIYSRNWGAATSNVAVGIHRPLQVKCLSIQTSQNTSPYLILTMDLGWWKNMEDEKKLRSSILEKFDLEESNVLICLSHTHAGPVINSDDSDKEGGELIQPYLTFIQQEAIAAIEIALTHAEPSIIKWQYGMCDLATNRDLLDPDDQNGYLVGYNPLKAADNTLLVAVVRNKENKVIASLVNYACHPTTLAWQNQYISPDYIGAMCELVSNHTDDAPCLFLQGASGDLAPAVQYTGDLSIADQHGRQLGYAVLSTIESMDHHPSTIAYDSKVQSGAPLAVHRPLDVPTSSFIRAIQVDVEMMLKDLPSLDELDSALHMCKDPVLKERLGRQRGIRKSLGEGSIFQSPLWVWRIGEVILLVQPNEAYSDYQIVLREMLHPTKVVLVNIANGYYGYLPPAYMYDRNQYAVWQTPFDKGSLEELIRISVSESIKILNNLI